MGAKQLPARAGEPMSNEKLGAEQGRALIEECGLALAAEEITCGHKHVKTFNKLNELRELAEQAYHAWGAAQLRHWTCRECSYQFDGGGNGVTYCPSCCKASLTEYVPSEPGADTGTTPPQGWCTGTTPPPEECYVAWCRYKDNRILLCDSDAPKAFKVYRWATLAERGTTPPEGLTREDVERCLKYATILGVDGNPEVSVFMLWDVLRNRAATQRAPVEQGAPPLRQWYESTPDGMRIAVCDGGEVPAQHLKREQGRESILTVEDVFKSHSFIGWDEQEESGPHRGRNKGWTEWTRKLNEIIAQRAAAPDHAREGALFLCRYRDSEGKECGAPIALNVDSYSGFIHTEGSGWLHWASPVRYGPQDSKAVFVKRADGKEGE